MSHLHIPDGILPPALWIGGLLLTAILLLLGTRGSAPRDVRGVAFTSALAAIMLAVMAIPLPITAFEYCMTLAGPVGVLVAPAASFQVAFMVTLVLALLGQGGFTVVGLNTLVLALGAVVARPVYRAYVGALGPARAMGFATAVSQLASTVCWGLLLALSVKLSPASANDHEMSHTVVGLLRGAGALVVVPMLLLAIAIEALLGAGLGGFLARVRPDLLPAAGKPK